MNKTRWYLGKKCDPPCTDCDALIWDETVESWYEETEEIVSTYPSELTSE